MGVEIGARLREERERLGLSQSKLGEELGVSLGSQGNYEGGKRDPDADYLSRAAVIGVDVLYVLTGRRLPAPSAHEGARDLDLLAACVLSVDQAIEAEQRVVPDDQRRKLYLGVYRACLAAGKFNPILAREMLALIPAAG